MKKYNRGFVCLLLVAALALSGVQFASATVPNLSPALLEFPMGGKITITNAEGEYITYNGTAQSGTMKVIAKTLTVEEPADHRSVPIHAMDGSLSSVDLVLESKSYSSSTASSMPWGSSLTYRANVYWDDGWHEVDDFAVVDWSLTDQNGNETQVWTKEWRGADGIARIKLFAPYGMTGNLTLKAISQIDPTFSDMQNITVVDGTSMTGQKYYRSEAGWGLPGGQVWDSNNGTYTMTFPDIPDELKNGKDKLISFNWVAYVDNVSAGTPYKPNSIISMSIDKHEYCDIDAKFKVFIPPSPPPVYYKSINGVYASDKAESVKITWNRVKSAKGYFIYKYNKAKKKYVKVATLKGRSKYAWSDKKVESGKTYKYKVQPYKIANGKKKKMKRSFWGSAIVASDNYSNALKVEITPSQTIKKKAGKTVKLNAKVYGEPDKKLINSKVRWYSNNKKVATVGKSGKVKFNKKGVCYIWAKAHNGKNSKKIKVIVR
jgi:hypothetical protein